MKNLDLSPISINIKERIKRINRFINKSPIDGNIQPEIYNLGSNSSDFKKLVVGANLNCIRRNPRMQKAVTNKYL